MNNKKILVIVASGIGSRMNSSIPKQYITLNKNKSMLDIIIDELTQDGWFDKVIVVVSINDVWYRKSKHFSNEKIISCWGGSIRAKSVFNALVALNESANNDDFIFVHDAARPCIKLDDFKYLHKQVLKSNSRAGIFAIPAFETIKKASSKQIVLKTIDREKVWFAQTPQIARYLDLKDSLKKCFADDYNVTDESSALEYSNIYPIILEGRKSNIKVTVQDDIDFVKYYLNKEEQETEAQND